MSFRRQSQQIGGDNPFLQQYNPRITVDSYYPRLSAAPTNNLSEKLSQYLKPQNFILIERKPLNTQQNRQLLLSEYLPNHQIQQPHGSPHFKYTWFILTAYALLYFFMAFISIILKGIAQSQPSVDECPFNLNFWYGSLQIFYAVSPFAAYYGIKVATKSGEYPFVYKTKTNRDGQTVYHFLYASTEKKSKVTLVILDSINLIFSVVILALYFENLDAIDQYCRPTNPFLFIIVPLLAFLGLFSIVRCFCLFYFFVFLAKRAQRSLQQNPRGQDIVQKKFVFKFPIIKYADYRLQCEEAICKLRQGKDLPGQNEEKENLGKNLGQNFDQQEVCPICCEIMKPDDRIVFLPCNVLHIYHTLCIRQWLNRNNSCPLCKTIVVDDANIMEEEIGADDII